MSEDVKFTFNFPDMSGNQVEIPLNPGNIIFVLGANGTGKSGLMHETYKQNLGKSKRITAHRQTWFTSNAPDFTPANKIQVENNMNSTDKQSTARYSDSFHIQRLQITIFNLINSQNKRNSKIAKAVDEDNIELAKKFRKKEAPLTTLNRLLKLAKLPLEIIIKDDEQLFAKKNGCAPYSIAELSDGERNAILIATDILTAKENTLFLIDEPERHLHRSIISPLLTSLFNKRPDCAFIIATHDTGLPLDRTDANTLLIRECKWGAKHIEGWDTDLIESTDSIDYQIKKDILGARRTLLFVEGDSNSLDQRIYNILFPEVTVIPQESCLNVEKAVSGIASTDSLHWIKAIGLIDADDHIECKIKQLKKSNIFTVSGYSVEAIYYNLRIIELVAIRSAALTSDDVSKFMEKAHKAIIENLKTHKKRLCARVCERKIKSKINAPDWKAIQEDNLFEITINLKEECDEELKKFDTLIKTNDIDGLIKRYPIRETGVLNEVANALKFEDCKHYERAVITLLTDDEKTRQYLRGMFGDLVQVLDSNTADQQKTPTKAA